MSLKRLASSIAWRVFPFGNLVLKLSSGLRISLQNRGDFPILQEIFMECSYDAFLEPLPEVRTWVDLGCNAGLFSLYLENWARERNWVGRRKALLIDANRFALKSARRSVEMNNFGDSIQISESAVGPRTGFVDFFESKSTYKSSVFKLASKERSRKVPVVDLIQACRFLGPRIDLVKADIEGGEKLLLEHWGDWLQTANYLIIEWHEPHMTGHGLNRLCEEIGFKLVVAKPPEYLRKERANALELPIGTGLWRNSDQSDHPLK